MKIKVLSFLVIHLLNSALSNEQKKQVHHELSDEQFQRIFRRERREASIFVVPEYDFVNIYPEIIIKREEPVEQKTGHRAKRELRPVVFQVDGNKKVELNLQPAEHQAMTNYIPVWRAKTEQGRQHNYEAVDQKQRKFDGIIYEDPKNMATLLAYYKDQYISYDGIFGEGTEAKVVRAIPEEWRDSESTEYGGNHVIFNVSSSGNVVALQPHEINSVSQKLNKPLDTFYVKLLVVVDYSLFEVLGKDVQETVRYVATFWNAVNLRYSKIKQPKIKVMVTGLIINEDLTAMDCLYRSRNQTDLKNVNPYTLLSRCGEYFHDEFNNVTKFENYDAIITMANLRSGPVLGTAFEGQICDSTSNVGYVRDDGNFDGVNTATHELGHLLSLPHDGKNGCEGYVDDKSTVMAPAAIAVKEYLWSICSQKSLLKFAWDKRAACLEKPYRYRH